MSGGFLGHHDPIAEGPRHQGPVSGFGGSLDTKVPWVRSGGPPRGQGPRAHLQVVVVAAEVGSDAVVPQQRPQQPHQAGSGAVLGHRPHRVVASHQHIAVVACSSQASPQPGQLRCCRPRILGALGGTPHPKVIPTTAEQHRVQHQQPGRGVGARQGEAQAVVVVREVPVGHRGLGDTWGHPRGTWGHGQAAMPGNKQQMHRGPGCAGGSLPSGRAVPICQLRGDIPSMVVVPSQHEPGQLPQPRGCEHLLEGLLPGQRGETQGGQGERATERDTWGHRMGTCRDSGS